MRIEKKKKEIEKIEEETALLTAKVSKKKSLEQLKKTEAAQHLAPLSTSQIIIWHPCFEKSS